MPDVLDLVAKARVDGLQSLQQLNKTLGDVGKSARDMAPAVRGEFAKIDIALSRLATSQKEFAQSGKTNWNDWRESLIKGGAALRNLSEGIKLANQQFNTPALKQWSEGMRTNLAQVQRQFQDYTRVMDQEAKKQPDREKAHRQEITHWKNFHDVAGKATDVVSRQMLPALNALGIANITASASLATLTGNVKRFADTAEVLNRARQLDFAPNLIRGLEAAAPVFDTTVEKMKEIESGVSSMMTKLSQAQTRAPIVQNLTRSGAGDLAGQLVGTATNKNLTIAQQNAEALYEILSKIADLREKGAPESTLREVAQQAGLSPDIVNLARSKKEVEDFYRTVRELANRQGPIIADVDAKKFRLAIAEMQAQLEGFGNAVAVNMVKPVTAFIDEVTKGIGVWTNFVDALNKGDVPKALGQFVAKPEDRILKPGLQPGKSKADWHSLIFGGGGATQPQKFGESGIFAPGSLGTGDITAGMRRSTNIEDERSVGQKIADDQSFRGTADNTRETQANTEQLRTLNEILRPLGPGGGGGFRPGIGNMPSGFGGGDSTTTSGAPSAPGAGHSRFPGQPTLDTTPRAGKPAAGTGKPSAVTPKPSSVVPLPQGKPSTAGPQFPKEFDPSKHQYLIPNMQDGGVVKAQPGGTIAVIGENGEDEAVVPLGRTNVAYSKSDSSTWGPARNNNPGSMAFNPAAGQYFGATSNTQIGPVKSDFIADFPTPVLGAASNMYLASTSSYYLGKTIAQGQANWAPRNARVLPGFDPNTVITPELTHNEDFMVKFMKSTAEAEGFTTPMTDADWHSAFLRKEAAQAREGSGLPPPNPTGAEGFASGRPYTSPQFPAVPGVAGISQTATTIKGGGTNPNLMPGLLSPSGPSMKFGAPGVANVTKDPNIGGVFQNETAVAALKSAQAAMPPGTSPATPEGRALINKYLQDGGRGLSAPQTAWCAATIMSGYKNVGAETLVRAQNDMATSFNTFGMPVAKKEDAQPGDIAVFRRGLGTNVGGGHVMWVREAGGPGDPLKLYGGNSGYAMPGRGGGMAKNVDASDALIKSEDIIIRHPPESPVQQFILGKQPMSGGETSTETFRPGPTVEAAAKLPKPSEAPKPQASATASVPSHQHGAMNVPEGLAYLHEGEMVVPEHIAEQVRNFGGGYGGGATDPTIDLWQRSAQNRADIKNAAIKWFPGLLGAASRMAQRGPQQSLATIQHARNHPDLAAQLGAQDVGKLGATEATKHTVEGSGTIDVNVKAPRGTSVKTGSTGMFKKVNLRRGMTSGRADEGPPATAD